MLDTAARAFVATSVALGEELSAALAALPPDPVVAARVAAQLELAADDKRQRARAMAATLAEVAIAVDRLELSWPR